MPGHPEPKTLPMRLDYRWIKDADGALDRGFVAMLARHFGIDAFVETGTYRGDTIAAVRGAFARLISIELSAEFAQTARQRFAGDAAVTILHADSATGLAQAFELLPGRPAILWLDAHYSGGPTAKGAGNTPILAEIDQIMAARDGRDVILVDDARLFWPVPPGFLSHDTLEGYPLLPELAVRMAGSRHGYRVFAQGDALLATPPGLEPSPVLAACTACRLAAPGAPANPALESTLLTSAGEERRALAELAPLIEQQKAYGLGGHYFYWRGLLQEAAGAVDAAREDLDFAARCGVIPPGRVPATPAP